VKLPEEILHPLKGDVSTIKPEVKPKPFLGAKVMADMAEILSWRCQQETTGSCP